MILIDAVKEGVSFKRQQQLLKCLYNPLEKITENSL
jgi:hypothetical protein